MIFSLQPIMFFFQRRVAVHRLHIFLGCMWWCSENTGSWRSWRLLCTEENVWQVQHGRQRSKWIACQILYSSEYFLVCAGIFQSHCVHWKISQVSTASISTAGVGSMIVRQDINSHHPPWKKRSNIFGRIWILTIKSGSNEKVSWHKRVRKTLKTVWHFIMLLRNFSHNGSRSSSCETTCTKHYIVCVNYR